MIDYLPKQRDIVWINFSPSSGHEIRKRRPAIIVSSDQFNQTTRFCVLCPITTKNKDYPSIVKLDDKEYKIRGSILTHQLRSVDYEFRGIEFVEQLSSVKWVETLEKIGMIF